MELATSVLEFGSPSQTISVFQSCRSLGGPGRGIGRDQAATTVSLSFNKVRPTGALTGALAGGYTGRRIGGIPGAIAGFGIGLVAPEALSNPTTILAAARAANRLGPALG